MNVKVRTRMGLAGPRWGWCLLAVASLAWGEDTPGVQYKPLKLSAIHEFGQIRSGRLVSRPTVIHDEWVDHFGSFLTQEALVENRLRLEIGLGGIFQFGKPERVNEVFGGSQYKMFFIGPTIAKATVLFGNPETPGFTLGGGLFPFKYNPDAVNLGEYLFRSGPYPTYIMNGGVLAIGDNAAYLQGFHAAAHLGNLNLDLLLISETNMAPLYDWSLAGLVNYSIAEGGLELGAGFNLKRIIPVDRDRTQRQEKGNAFFTRNGFDYSGDEFYYRQQADFWNGRLDGASSADSIVYIRKKDSAQAIVDSLAAWLDPVTKTYPGASYYTPAGTIINARISLDIRKLFDLSSLRPGDLRIYSEAALLGWKDYPVFYKNRMERLPIMAGINFPTFGLLDLAALQIEYFDSPFENSTLSLGGANHATPYYPAGVDPTGAYSKYDYNDQARLDNWAWSVILRRTFLSSFTVSAQAARDHLRTVGTDWFYGSRLEPNAILHKVSDWYWMLQLSWAI
jgi:hypothetical protein